MRNILPYVYDYVSVLFEESDIKKATRRLILFGSVARGEFDSKSDIDIFLEVSPGLKDKMQELVRKSGNRFSLVSEKKWHPLGIRNPVKTIVGSLEEPRWKELREEIISTGITLYGKFESLPEKLKHYSLFSYSLSGLSQKNKMKLLRMLFGYTIKKNAKEYPQTGMLEEIGGRKIGPNSILVPLEKSREIQKLFSRFRVTPEIREVWIK